MKWLRISLFAQAALALYFQAFSWLPMGRWNAQPGYPPLAVQAMRGTLTAGDVLLVLAFLLPFALYAIALGRRWTWLMALGLVGYGVWLALQIVSWWVPYVFGASDGWARTYARVFAGTTQLLPRFGRHLPPDGMHLVLQALLCIVVASLARGLWSRPAAMR